MSRPRTSMLDRFWSKVDRRTDDECWLWLGGRNSTNYGVIAEGGAHRRSLLAHRVSAAIHFGMFDQRLLVLHHCDNPPCVNPAHLYLGSYADNSRDMSERGRFWQWTKTHCPKGHEYTAENTYLYKGRGRSCRACHRICDRKRRAKNRAS